MKRSTRNLLKAVLICFVIGAAFGIAGLCTGFRAADFQTVLDGGYFTVATPVKEKVSGVVTEATGGRRSYNSTFSGVEKLKLDTGVADCRIIPYDGEVWKVSGSNLPSGFRCRKSGSELKIDCTNFWGLFNFSNRHVQLDIYIPQSQEVEKLEIDAGVGDWQVGDEFLKCKNLEIDSGVGDCTIRADITGKLDIDGGVGDIHLILKGGEEDFNYDIDGGIGSLDIGDSHYSDLGNEEKIDNHASKDIKIDSGVGEITIEFE